LLQRLPKYYLPISLTAQLRDQDLSGDDQTHLVAAQTQILCLIIRFGHVMAKAYNKTCITGSKTYVLASSMMDWGEMPNADKGKK
jgi:hypothetical protein